MKILILCAYIFLLSTKLLIAENVTLKDSLSPKILTNSVDIFKSDKNKPCASISQEEFILLKEGDILLRKGYGWISDRIAEVLNENLKVTHCGMILTEGYSEPQVLHSISNEDVDGVFTESLSEFLKESQHGSIIAVRLRCSSREIDATVKESKRLLEKKIPFDLGFDDTDSSSMYCAELFFNVFKNIFHRDLLPEKINLFGKNAIRMRNFLNPAEFEILFNQFNTNTR